MPCGRPDDDQLVFPNGSGQLWTDAKFRNWRREYFQPAAEAAGLPDATLYTCRHSFACGCNGNRDLQSLVMKGSPVRVRASASLPARYRAEVRDRLAPLHARRPCRPVCPCRRRVLHRRASGERSRDRRICSRLCRSVLTAPARQAASPTPQVACRRADPLSGDAFRSGA